jgi:hypothetical protein
MAPTEETTGYYENGWNQCVDIFSSPHRDSPEYNLILQQISIHGNQKELFLFSAEYLNEVEIKDKCFVLQFIGKVYFHIKKQHLYRNEFLRVIDIVMDEFLDQFEDICLDELDKVVNFDIILTQLEILSNTQPIEPTIEIIDKFIHSVLITNSTTLYQKSFVFLQKSKLSLVQLLETRSESVGNIIALYGYFNYIPSVLDNLYLFNKLIIHLLKDIRHESIIKFHLNLMQILFQRVNLNNLLLTTSETSEFELFINRVISLISSSNSMDQSIEIYNLLKKIIFKFNIKSREYIIMKCMTSGVYCLEQISIELIKYQLDNEQSDYFWGLIESIKGVVFDFDSQFYKNQQFGLPTIKADNAQLLPTIKADNAQLPHTIKADNAQLPPTIKADNAQLLPTIKENNAQLADLDDLSGLSEVAAPDTNRHDESSDDQNIKDKSVGLANIKENNSLLVFKLDLILSSLNFLYYILRKKDVEWKENVYVMFVDVIKELVRDMLEISKEKGFKVVIEEANIEVSYILT